MCFVADFRMPTFHDSPSEQRNKAYFHREVLSVQRVSFSFGRINERCEIDDGFEMRVVGIEFGLFDFEIGRMYDDAKPGVLYQHER